MKNAIKFLVIIPVALMVVFSIKPAGFAFASNSYTAASWSGTGAGGCSTFNYASINGTWTDNGTTNESNPVYTNGTYWLWYTNHFSDHRWAFSLQDPPTSISGGYSGICASNLNANSDPTYSDGHGSGFNGSGTGSVGYGTLDLVTGGGGGSTSTPTSTPISVDQSPMIYFFAIVLFAIFFTIGRSI